MIRRDIKRNIGKIVAYTDRSGNILPAKILDARLWAHYKGPSPQVEPMNSGRPLAFGGTTVGYPVLLPCRSLHRSAKQDRDLLEWLRNTTITMEDLFNERGAPREPARWSEIEGTFFRVVFPQSIRENYPGLVREKAARDRQRIAELKAARLSFEARQKAAVDFSNALAKFGFTSPDELPIIGTIGLMHGRVTIPTAALDELLRVATPYLDGCGICGARDFLLPYGEKFNHPWMLCATCHPQVDK